MALQVIDPSDGFILYEEDIALLTGTNWCNDRILHFGLKYALSPKNFPENIPKLSPSSSSSSFHTIDPIALSYLNHLCESEEEKIQFGRDNNYHQKKNEKKTFFFLPVANNSSSFSSSSHWSLLLFYTSSKTFLHFDSIENSGNNYVAEKLAENISIAFGISSAGVPFNMKFPSTPRQSNSYDCGVYVILMAEVLADFLHSNLHPYDDDDTESNYHFKEAIEVDNYESSNNSNDSKKRKTSFSLITEEVIAEMEDLLREKVTPNAAKEYRKKLFSYFKSLLRPAT